MIRRVLIAWHEWKEAKHKSLAQQAEGERDRFAEMGMELTAMMIQQAVWHEERMANHHSAALAKLRSKG